MNAFTLGFYDVEKVIQLPIQEEIISMNDLYTAGIFPDESHYRREKSHDFKISTELTVTI